MNEKQTKQLEEKRKELIGEVKRDPRTRMYVGLLIGGTIVSVIVFYLLVFKILGL